MKPIEYILIFLFLAFFGFGIAWIVDEDHSRKEKKKRYEAQFDCLIGKDILIANDTFSVANLDHDSQKFGCEIINANNEKRVTLKYCIAKQINPESCQPSE